MQRLETATPCTWRTGCANTTRDTDGRCHLHKGEPLATDPAVRPGPPPASATSPSPGDQAQVAGRVRTKEPREYQDYASSEVIKELQGQDRCQIRAACGMGKTIIAQDTIRKHFHEGDPESGVYIYVTSGIQLTKQSRDDFDQDGVLGEHLALSVHDDSDDLDPNKTKDGEDKREKDIQTIMEFLSTETDRPRVIFSTYNSQDKIIEAQRRLRDAADDGEYDGDPEADMILFDEAHRLGGTYKFDPKAGKGKKGSGSGEFDEEPLTVKGRVPRIFFNDVDGSMQGRKRLFISATPKSEDEKARGGVTKTHVDGLRAVYRAEDEVLANPSKKWAAKDLPFTVLMHDNREVFGRSVVSWGLNDATSERFRSLVPLEPEVAPVRVAAGVGPKSRVSIDGSPVSGQDEAPGTMTVPAYSVARGALESLADDDGGRNVLAFSGRIKDATDVKNNINAMALQASRDLHNGTEMSLDEARSVLSAESSLPDARKAARMRMLAEYARAETASSESTQKDRDAAIGLYDDQGCACGSPGGWCACARIVSNVDLFGQGINVRQVDTVVLGDVDKTGDIPLTQAVGRAMRRWDDRPGGAKGKGRVVIPEVSTEDGDRLNQPLVARSLYGVSRLFRDSIGKSLEGRQMEPQAPISVRTIGGGKRQIDEDIAERFPGSTAQIGLYAAYQAVEREASTEYNKNNKGSGSTWGKLTPEERHRMVLAKAQDPSGKSDAGVIIGLAQPTMSEVEDADAAAKLLVRRAHGFDRDGLSAQERRLCERAGVLDKNGGVPGKLTDFSFKRLHTAMGSALGKAIFADRQIPAA